MNNARLQQGIKKSMWMDKLNYQVQPMHNVCSSKVHLDVSCVFKVERIYICLRIIVHNKSQIRVC